MCVKFFSLSLLPFLEVKTNYNRFKGLNRSSVYIPDFIPKEHIFKGFSPCVQWIKENITDES